jgi:uncharacterized protein YdaU (DUF1376 family)
MYFFPLHIGDYTSATVHLSWLEDAAYMRMLRRYYQDERPLPADVHEVQWLVGARVKSEKVAVEVVLKRFFELRPDGWHQKRADAEIENYQRRVEKARAAGKLGGRPRKTVNQSRNRDLEMPDDDLDESDPFR